MVDAVRGALSESLKAPAEDPSVRLIDYPASQFSIPFPDQHSDRYALVEVTMFSGRSLETKRRLYQMIVAALVPFGIPANDMVIVLHEPPMHNWGVSGGVPASEADVGFRVDI